MKAQSEIEKREAERAVLAALIAKCDNAEWRKVGSWHHLPDVATAAELRAFMDAEYPSLIPQPERVTLYTQGDWEYAPHENTSYPWRDVLSRENRRHIFPPPRVGTFSVQDLRKLADAMEKYHTRYTEGGK